MKEYVVVYKTKDDKLFRRTFDKMEDASKLMTELINDMYLDVDDVIGFSGDNLEAFKPRLKPIVETVKVQKTKDDETEFDKDYSEELAEDETPFPRKPAYRGGKLAKKFGA